MHARAVAAGFAALAWAAAAHAQQIDWAPVAIQGPYAGHATAVPSSAELMAAWPEAAAKKHQEGFALARCTADAAGALGECRVITERPAQAGFGPALLSLAPRFRLAPANQVERPSPTPDVLIFANWPVPDTPPDWPTPPKAGDFIVAASPAAWHAGKPAYVLMNCMVGRLGDTHSCMVVYQDPPGLGFGQMTLRFASYLKLKPATLAGKPIPTGATITFRYRAPGN